jgi:hypothetical protein
MPGIAKKAKKAKTAANSSLVNKKKPHHDSHRGISSSPWPGTLYSDNENNESIDTLESFTTRSEMFNAEANARPDAVCVQFVANQSSNEANCTRHWSSLWCPVLQ